jgi:CheY-like chemotaxis protein
VTDERSLPTAPTRPTRDGAVSEPLLMAAIGHGVRTPLHSLVGFLELLFLTDLDDEQVRLLEQVIAGTDSLVAVMDRIMLLLRLTSGSRAGHLEPVALDELINRILSGTGLGQRQADLVPVLSPSLNRLVTADAPMLQHLLSTVIDGAVDRRADRAAGTVTVTAAAHDHEGTVLLRVNVTEPENAVDADVPADLVEVALTEALTTCLGATLTCTPGGRGTGRITSVTVPLAALAALAPMPLPVAVPVPVPMQVAASAVDLPTSLRVLLAEDNEVNRMLAQRQLSKLGHALTTVEGGVAAVEAAAAGGFDVVLMDCHMPDLDGLEATRRIRAAEARSGHGRRIPIIAVTADALAENRAACLTAGMDDFLSKPVDLGQLGAAIRRWTAGEDAPAAPAVAPVPGPPSPAATVGEAVDHAVLERLLDQLDGDHGAVAALVETYLARLPAYRLRLRAASRQTDAGYLVPSARTLRSASDAVGAIELSHACAALERPSAQAGQPDSAALITGLLDSCDRTVEALARYRQPVTAATAPGCGV